MFDVLIIGGGPAAISCGLVLGSAANKSYMQDKKMGMIAYAKAGDLNAALLNNLFGVASGTKGKQLIADELERLKTFKAIEQLAAEPIERIEAKEDYYIVSTAKDNYQSKAVVLAIGHNPKIAKIGGLEDITQAHSNSLPGVNKTAIRHSNLMVKDGLYVAGLTADCASQAAIAAGVGAEVAVHLLSKWNGNIFDHAHDK